MEMVPELTSPSVRVPGHALLPIEPEPADAPQLSEPMDPWVVGETVGLIVGTLVGSTVGSAVGVMVGAAVG